MSYLKLGLCSVLVFIAIASVALAANRSESYFYDGAGRLVEVHYSDGSSIRYSYDANGNRLLRDSSSSTPGPFPVEPAVTLTKSGADLLITYPIVSCNAPDHVVLFGAIGDFSTVIGAECSVGDSGTALVTAPAGSVWFLVAGVEGARYSGVGSSSDGVPRTPSGAGAVCAGIVQDTTGVCP